MSRYEDAAKWLIKIIEDKVPPSSPSPFVKKIYETAVDRFGEDSVDLQRNNCWETLETFFRNRTMEELCREVFHIWGALSKTTRDFLIDAGEDGISAAYTLYDHFSIEMEIGEKLTERKLKEANVPIYAIMVRFKDFEITNERGDHTHIEEMFARVGISCRGYLFPFIYWARSIYSSDHYYSHYAHSHLRYVDDAPASAKLSHPCLGTGPINMTIEELQTSKDLDVWDLFWLELDNCIRVESLAGGPYMRIRDIQKGTQTRSPINSFGVKCKTTPTYLGFTTENIIRKILSQRALKLVFRNNKIVIANNFVETNLIISNIALKIIKMGRDDSEFDTAVQDLISHGCLYNGFIRNNLEIVPILGQNSLEKVEPFKTNYTFKGEPVYRQVLPSIKGEVGSTYTFLNVDIVNFICKQVTLLVNYFYGK